MDDQTVQKKLKANPTLSVIIPTYNGAQRIQRALEALEKQTFKKFEVVVVIDGSTDQTEQFLEGWRTRLNLQFMVQENKGRAGARNTGAAMAQSGLLVFLDDDMRPDPGWLQSHIDHHRSHSHSAMVGRQQSDPHRNPSDFNQYLAVRSSEWMNNCKQSKNPMTMHNLFFTSANCSMPKPLFDIVGGFDDQLRDAEDFDLGYRLLKKGQQICFNPDSWAWHDDFPDLTKYIERQRQYREAWFELIKLRPEITDDTARFNPNPPKGLRGLFFKLFASSSWISIAESHLFHALVPRTWRFKIYDYTIASLGRFNRHVNLR